MVEEKLLLSRFALVLLLAFTACKKEESVYERTAPELELLSLAPLQLQALEDSLVFQLRYHDGDGDLGGGHADSNNLFITDLRNNLRYAYRIKELVPQGASVPIRGELQVQINALFLVDESASREGATFEIYCVDRAGNVSNILQTQEVIITK